MEKKLISLFAGAGGMDIGFHAAGFSTAVAVEQDPSCCNTLRLNMPDTPVIEGDITSITTQAILEAAKVNPLEIDLVIGGPPCQSFSLAGRRMGMDDPRGMLVLEFLRVVREALPKCFVMENVKGMINWSKGKALEAIMTEASQPIKYAGKEYKYAVSYHVLNAADFGVPQFRERVFIVGNRLGKTFQFPEPTHGPSNQARQIDLFGKQLKPYKTVQDAISTLPPATPPSAMALRVSQTIKDRIKNHGY
ncbi:DNA cytosine methyltransferase [Picosynechococcus sp. PCC 11901]|uniref:DNA cytosine methyltransferase n=1 Tax=unclassified Picosynechococcus TaxID=3079910 RepID=UPI0004AA9E3F|nr:MULTISPECIES: DNA cytosine methyltransferase [unclassified Picosynechococcus]ANV87059.1 DNA (cytosine-5-)-methyltransferase [Picosynechococcus sp. PCC 7117]QCS49757.1 DNA cytosine methyltransferase [Picosynechococcus sp. PCC 11901]